VRLTIKQTVTCLFGVPGIFLAGAYLWLALDHKTLWLFPVVVHESGRYTLAETLLYYRHVIRELPITFFYAISTAAAFQVYGPRFRVPLGERSGWKGPATLATLLVVWSWIGTASDWGSEVAIKEFLQGYTRDDLFTPGSHWRFHLLSTACYLTGAVILAASLHHALCGRLPSVHVGSRKWWMGGTILAMIVLTALIGLTAEPFGDPRYLGHQAREALTHLFVTLPISMGVLLLYDVSTGQTQKTGRSTRCRRSRQQSIGHIAVPSCKIRNDLMVAVVILILVLGYLVGGTIIFEAVRHTRPDTPLSHLGAGHLFEHTLDYVLVACLALTASRATDATIYDHPIGERSRGA